MRNEMGLSSWRVLVTSANLSFRYILKRCINHYISSIQSAGSESMGCSRENVGQLSLDEFVRVVATIYRAHDKRRSMWDVWCHTMHHAAGIAEQIRRGQSEKDLHTETADFSLWLFTMVLKLSGEFGSSEGRAETLQESFIRIKSSCSDLLWHKYPKLCPFCSLRRIADNSDGSLNGRLISCECLGHQPKNEQSDARRERLMTVRLYSDQIHDEKLTSMNDWQEMFGRIFANHLDSL